MGFEGPVVAHEAEKKRRTFHPVPPAQAKA